MQRLNQLINMLNSIKKGNTNFLLLLSLFVLGITSSSAQKVGDVYTKPLTEVLRTIEKKFNIVLKIDDRSAKRDVSYANWRITSDLKTTLDNVLRPLDLVYNKVSGNTYKVDSYDYYRRSPAEGRYHLDELLRAYPTAAAFDKRKKELRQCISSALGINLNGLRTPLNPIFRKKVVMDGYTVENVAFESIPGYYVTGTLYRPTKENGSFPVILNPHGHFFNEEDPSISADSGRYRADMQIRCAAFAKMGAIAFSYDMYAWGESLKMVGDPLAHETGFATSIQTWNSIRAVDFLLTLPGADKNRVAVTGASGGGTQTILLAAMDDRVSVSIPVVMVSSTFYGGCPCESGAPIHSVCDGHSTNNAEIAAMIAPRPLMLVSDGDDWTKNVPGTDDPYLQKIYKLYEMPIFFESVYLPVDKHDYGITKRIPMYKFMAKHLRLNASAITGKDGRIDESGITIQPNKDLLVFGTGFPLPSHALRSHKEIMKVFQSVQNR